MSTSDLRFRDADGNEQSVSPSNPLPVKLGTDPTINIGEVKLLGDDGAVVAGSAGDAAAASGTWTAMFKYIAAVLGVSTGTKVVTDANGTIQQYLRGLVSLIVAKITVGFDQATPGTTNGVVVNSIAGTYQETTIATGGTAQNLFSGATPANGYEVINPHASETLYCREAGAAAVSGASSIPIPAGVGYITPRGCKPTGAVSVIAATTGHGVVARAF